MLDVGCKSKTKTEHQHAEPTKAKTNRTGYRKICIVSLRMFASIRPNANEAPERCECIGEPEGNAFAVGPLDAWLSGRAVGIGSGNCVFHVADKRFLKTVGATRFNQLLRCVTGEHLARIHLARSDRGADPLIHEVGRDEDRDALLSRKFDQ